jgi:nucleoside phosphorylase
MRRPLALALVVLSLGVVARGPGAAAATEPCTRRVLVVSAFPGEIDRLLTSATIKKTVVADDRTFYVGSLEGNEVVMALTGIGMVNAEQTAKAAFGQFRCGSGPGISAVVFSGVAGGEYIGDVTVPTRWTQDDGKTWLRVDPAMFSTARKVAGSVKLAQEAPVGDLACAGSDPDLVATVSVDHAPRVVMGGDGQTADPFGGRRLPCFPGGGDVFGCEPCRAPSHQTPDVERTVTGAVPFLDPNFFFGYFQAPPTTDSKYAAQDMETAAVARVAAENRTPFIAFRGVSDGKGDPLQLPGFPFQFFYYRQLAADNAGGVALAFLKAWAAKH